MSNARNTAPPAVEFDTSDQSLSIGQRLRRYVLGMIESGVWAEGDRVPSEPQLAEQLGISRMTVHIALRDLAAEGHLIRRQGAGTFVAPRKSESTVMELRNIKDEIETRGNRHSVDIRVLETVNSDLGLATEMGIAPGSLLYHSVIVHRENGNPLQIEDRFVSPQFAPDYLSQDFTKVTPNEHLMSIGPLEEVEHVIQAIPADKTAATLLEMKEGEAVLLIRRRTWSKGMIVTSARLRHPGARFSLAARVGSGRQT